MVGRELSETEILAVDFLMTGMVREDIDKFVELAKEYEMDRRTQTMLMHKFISDFARSGWHGHKPSEILLETIKITKAVGQDTKA